MLNLRPALKTNAGEVHSRANNAPGGQWALKIDYGGFPLGLPFGGSIIRIIVFGFRVAFLRVQGLGFRIKGVGLSGEGCRAEISRLCLPP